MGKVSAIAGNWRIGLVGSIALASAGIGGAVVSTPAVAATPHVVSTELDRSDATVTSSTGQKLEIEVDAFVEPSAPADGFATVTLTKEIGHDGDSGEEDHSWMLPIHATDLSATPAGKGRLRLSSKEISPFGALALTMAPTGSATAKNCGGSAAASVQHVKLSGSLDFVTRSTGAHKWGTVGSKNVKRTFTFPGKSELIRYFPGGDDCLNGDDGASGSLPCLSAVMWDSNAGNNDISGFEFLGTEIVTGDRLTALHSPAGALREDDIVGPMQAPALSVTAPAAPPVVGALDATLAVVGNTGISAGRATIISTSAQAPRLVACGSSGQSENATGWSASAYINVAASPLTLTSQIFHGIKVANNATATVLQFAPITASPTPTPSPTASQAAAIATAHLHAAATQAANARTALTYVERTVRDRRLHSLSH